MTAWCHKLVARCLIARNFLQNNIPPPSPVYLPAPHSKNFAMDSPKLGHAVALLLLGLVLAAPASGQGIIVDHDWHFGNVTLEHSDVNVRIANNIAHVSVMHEFMNSGSRPAEGTFLFPLPKDASVADFQMEMGGRMVSGEVLPADEARSIYRRIVQKNLDPALLEWVDGRTFRASIFPIAPHGSQKILLEYDLVLEQNGNRYRFVHPMSGIVSGPRSTAPWRPSPRPGPRPYDDRRLNNQPDGSDRGNTQAKKKPLSHFTLSVSIDPGSGGEIRNVYSPSHDVTIDYQSGKRVNVDLRSMDDAQGSFVLYYTRDADRISATLLPHRPYRDEPGYFMLMIAPPSRPTGEILPKDIVFVLDKSGSMSGEKIEQAKQALRYSLNNLGADDRFGIVSFSSDVDTFRDGLARRASLDDALYFVDQIKAKGGTNINDALLKALAMLDDARNASIIFLTDGLPSSGVTNAEKIIRNVLDANDEGVNLFSFGVGYDVNTRLLDDLSESTAAFAEYITPEDNLEETVSNFYDRVRYPVLSDVKIEIPGADVFAMAPRSLPDLFVGDPLIVTGRYRKSAAPTAVLTGKSGGRTVRMTWKLDFPDRSRRDEFVPRIWATRRVGQLLADIRRNGEDPELKDEVVELATEYGIVTPYTSYLVLEDEDMAMLRPRQIPKDRLGAPRSGRVQLDAASDVEMLSVGESGAAAVTASKRYNEMQQTASVAANRLVRGINAAGQNFVKYGDSTWVSNLVSKEDATNGKPAVQIQFASDAYFAMIDRYPEMKEFLQLGASVEFVYNRQLVQVGADGLEKVTEAQLVGWFGEE